MIITSTPLRVSFAGGGTDFKDYYEKYTGMVVSSTIDKYIYVMVKKRFDDKVVAHYRKTEMVDKVDNLKHGLIREALKLVGIKKGIEISTTADILSTGSGLGSSSAMTVGLLHSLYTYLGELPSKEKLAQEACKIEIDILGSPIGKQDQYTVAYGGLNSITFLQDGKVEIESLKLNRQTKEKLNKSLLLLYTGIARESNSILSEQKENIKDRINILTEIKNIAKEIRHRLEQGYLDGFGTLLDRNWQLKKKMASGITNPEIDELYQKALDAGALGGKITGAGGGGFLLLYCPVEKQERLRMSLLDIKELPLNLINEGSKVIFDSG